MTKACKECINRHLGCSHYCTRGTEWRELIEIIRIKNKAERGTQSLSLEIDRRLRHGKASK